jgi:hypothetical protein
MGRGWGRVSYDFFFTKVLKKQGFARLRMAQN